MTVKPCDQLFERAAAISTRRRNASVLDEELTFRILSNLAC
jgi:hypothetical protein